MLIHILCFIIGLVLGFSFMYLVAVAMVRKSNEQLIRQYASAVDEWIDVVDDITAAMYRGTYCNKGIKEQIAITQRIIDDRKKEDEKPEVLKPEGADE